MQHLDNMQIEHHEEFLFRNFFAQIKLSKSHLNEDLLCFAKEIRCLHVRTDMEWFDDLKVRFYTYG